MIHYPAEVVKPKKLYVGLGISSTVKPCDKVSLLEIQTIYARYGLPYGFDIGLSINTLLPYLLGNIHFIKYPQLLVMSARKQFNVNISILNGITLDAGYGYTIRGGGQFISSISMISEDFALTSGISKHYLLYPLLDPSYDVLYSINSIFSRLTYDIKYNDFHLMPFIYYQYEVWEDRYNSLIDFSSLTERNETNLLIGAGFTVYFDLF